MRDLMFACAMLMAVPLAFFKPVIGYYLWGWTALLIPTGYFYGFMAQARLNFTLAILTLVLVVLGSVKWRDYQNNRVTWLYLIFLLHGTLAFALGYPGNPLNAYYYELLVKLMAFCLLMPLFVNSRLRMHVMLLVIVLGLGLHGLLDGLKTLATAGKHVIGGVSGSMLNDRNHLAVALVVALPIAYYLYLYSQNRFVRWGFLCVFGLLALAVMGSKSRGGFLALSVVGVWLIMTSRRKILTFLIVGLLGAAFLTYSPEQWSDRISTIQRVDQDESFMARVVAWKISSAVALGNPIFGGGFHAVQTQYVWDTFRMSQGLLGFVDTPVPEPTARAAHSIYFEIMGDTGFVGFFIFLTILFHAIYSRFAIKRMVNRLGPQYIWARDMADMLMLSIIAYMAGGAGVSLGYLEAIYIVIMLMEMLRVHVRNASTN